MLKRTKLPWLVAIGLGIVLGYIAASRQLDSLTKLWAGNPTALGHGESTTSENETEGDQGSQQAAVAASAWPRLPAQEVLPFPPTPSPSIAGRTMQDSVYKQRVEPRRLPK